MTPERREKLEQIIREHDAELLAEIDRLTVDRDQLSNALDLAAAELDAQTKEIDRLNKVVDQAIELCDIQIVGTSVGVPGLELLTDKAPELAAELERRSKVSNEKRDTMDKP